jgi:enoyl-CoA hydratase/carnithine racemase
MTTEAPVLYTISQRVARLTMNRPEAMNAMSRSMITELRESLERAQHDPEAALIVLSGAGGNFCAGDDLKEAEQQSSEEFLALIMDLQRLTRLLMGEKPTIAALDGYAVGGGFELALACDFRLATTSVLLPHLVGQGLAREIVLMAEVFDAARASQMGLLHRLVDPASLDAEVHKLAETLLSRAPLAVRESKRLLNRPLESELERAFQNELEVIMRCFNTVDAHEAAVAFREKRRPVFRGQ